MCYEGISPAMMLPAVKQDKKEWERLARRRCEIQEERESEQIWWLTTTAFPNLEDELWTKKFKYVDYAWLQGSYSW